MMNMEVRLDNGTLRYFNDGVEITRDEYLTLTAAEAVQTDKQPEIFSYVVHLDGRIEV